MPRRRIQVTCPKCKKSRGVLPYNLKRMFSMMCNPCAISQKVDGFNKTAHPLYEVWRSMVRRCHEVNNPQYHRYGARGIYVCDEWQNDFSRFVEWSSLAGYAEGLQIDRIDNDGPYSPENCRYVAAMQNANNRRNNVRLTALGKTQTVSEWARECGVTSAAIMSRLRSGHSVEKAVTAKRWCCR